MLNMKNFHIIVATDIDRGIGLKGDLPWHLPEDLTYFKKLTSTSTPGKKNMVIMGRRTWESLPETFRPLPGRVNAVISQTQKFEVPESTHKFSSLDNALEFAQNTPEIDQCFVIGGGQLYAEAIQHPWLDILSITLIQTPFECDTFFPDYTDFELFAQTPIQLSKSGIPFQIQEFTRKQI